jgi:hypothetical protein
METIKIYYADVGCKGGLLSGDEKDFLLYRQIKSPKLAQVVSCHDSIFLTRIDSEMETKFYESTGYS